MSRAEEVEIESRCSIVESRVVGDDSEADMRWHAGAGTPTPMFQQGVCEGKKAGGMIEGKEERERTDHAP